MVRRLQGPLPQARPRGARALTGAVIAMVGALAAANPESEVLLALAEAVPRLAEAVPAAITACGSIIAAISAPPRLGRR